MHIFTTKYIHALFHKTVFTVMNKKPKVLTKSILLSIKIGLIFNRPICVYQPTPFGTFFPCVWHQNCSRYSVMASERSPPLGSFVLSAKIPKLSLPSASSPKPLELPMRNQSKNDNRLVSTDVGFQKVPLINFDTVKEVHELEKEMLPKNAGKKRKVSDEILDEDIKPDDSDVMMKFVATGLPSSVELKKKSTILPSSLLQGVTDFVRKTVDTDACKSEPSGLVTHSDQSLITNIRADVTRELPATLEMLTGSATENIDMDSERDLVKFGGEIKNRNMSSEETERLMAINRGNISRLSSIFLSKEVHLIQSVHMQHKLMSSCCKGDLNYSIMSPEIHGSQCMELATEKLQSSASTENDEDRFETQHDRFASDTDELSTAKMKQSIEVTSENLFVKDLEKDSSVVRTAKKDSSVVRTAKKDSSVVRTAKKDSSVVRTTENKLADLKDAFDISVLFSDKFDKEFKKYKQQAKKRAKEKARKQKKKEVQSSRKQSEEGKDEDSGNITKKKNPVPNYFIAIQITNPVIHEALRKVQNRVVDQNKELLPALNPIPTLHLTVFVMHLASNEDIQRAKDALDECCKELKGQYMHNPLILDIHGLGHFRNEVVFAKVSPEENVQKLQTIADVVETYFEAHDIPSIDKKGFKPHITVMKLSRAPKLRKKGIKKIEPYLFQEFVSSYFGVQEVSGLQLCAMLKPKAKSGYYQVEHENIFWETTKTSADDELFKMSCTIVQSCIKAAVYRLEQENLATETSQGVKIVSHLEQKSESSQDKKMNLYENEQILDPDDAKCAEKQESKIVHDDKPKSPHNE